MPRGMAGECYGHAPGGRSGHKIQGCRFRKRSRDLRRNGGWQTLPGTNKDAVIHRPGSRSTPYLLLLVLLFAVLYVLLLLAGPAEAATQVSSIRVWSAQEYTRVTLETKTPVKHSLLTVKDPERLVLDLEDIEITAVLTGIG